MNRKTDAVFKRKSRMINSKELDELERQLALYKFLLEMEKGERSILEDGTISSKDLKKELGI
jgi:hypothetical protein